LYQQYRKNNTALKEGLKFIRKIQKNTVSIEAVFFGPVGKEKHCAQLEKGIK
jgi:hypothetical protein